MSVTLTREQIRRIDELAIRRYGIPSLVLMENAGRGAAEIIHQHYGPEGTAAIFCGPGNNGGDGCVIARHLHNAGWRVLVVVTSDEATMSADLRTNFGIVRAMGLDLTVVHNATEQKEAIDRLTGATVIVDALLGTGFQGEVRPAMAELIARINGATRRAIVAIDVPSGLNCDTGDPSNATIRADRTITFVAMKIGFRWSNAPTYLGIVDVVPIGAPRELIDEIVSGGH